jgi:hypothetical protein
VLIKWDSFSYEYEFNSDGDKSPKALLLKLPSSFKKGDRSFKVYFTPDVKNGDGLSVRPTAVLMNGVIDGLVDEVDGGTEEL